jgi:hypothetical protein
MADLLPPASTELERAFAQSSDVYGELFTDIARMRGIKFINTPPSFLPWLVYEYGLGELTPYVPNLYDVINEGIDWQRVRGTPAAVATGLGWLTYGGSIEEAPTRRRFWNTWQISLDRLRDDEADLIRIEGILSLSVSLRSVFRRGFYGYDVRELELGWSKWGETLYSDDSGVRLPPGAAKWSFGRSLEQSHDMTQDELEALDVWLDPVGSDPLMWGPYPWGPFAWVDSAALVRSATMLSGTGDGPAWAVFRDADGDVIGYRRCRVRQAVAPATTGLYRIGSSQFSPGDGAMTRLYVEALTDFGDGFGSVAESVGFILSAEPEPGHKPGALWLPAGGLDPDLPEVAVQVQQIEFGRTVRERVAALLRF